MLPKLFKVVRAGSAIIMIAAVCFLSTANFWVYGLPKQKQVSSAITSPVEEEQDSSGTGGGNPAQEKNSNALQNLSAYLHCHHHHLDHPVAVHFFGNRHDILNYPVHHCELITPPPKAIV